MADDLQDKIPDWLKSLYHMENELRSSARNGLILRKDERSIIWPRRAATLKRR
jgi:hypothetical protein